MKTSDNKTEVWQETTELCKAIILQLKINQIQVKIRNSKLIHGSNKGMKASYLSPVAKHIKLRSWVKNNSVVTKGERGRDKFGIYKWHCYI